MKKILFVCLGNICRSPMAEGIFKANNPYNFHIESRATSSWEHGNPVHSGTAKILEKHNHNISNMFSQKISKEDFFDFDYIIGMDNQNVKDLLRMAPHGTKDKIHLFLDAVDGYQNQDVPDPWYTGDFEETENLILKGLPIWNEIVKDSE